MNRPLTDTHKAYLLKLARQSIAQTLGKTAVVRNTELDRELAYPAATFVTLTEANELRGCIGSLQASRNIVDDVIHVARSAAFHDPRFAPLTVAELATLDIEISVLTEPVPIYFASTAELYAQLQPNVDGVVVKQQSKQATFLPQVWQQLPDCARFIEQLMLKAGIDPDTSITALDVCRYQVIDFHEPR